MTENSEMLKSALALAGAGFQVFPCIYATKLPPRCSRGFYDATGNTAVVRRLFGGSVRRNVGVRTGMASGFWVLDEDEPGALAALEARHGKLPVTRAVKTARGLHLWWRLGTVPVSGSKKKVGPGLDVRGEGNYVLAPPSRHPDGPLYRWQNDASLVEAPQWLVELAVRRPAPVMPISVRALHGRPHAAGGAYGRAALDREITALANASEGGRNNLLNRSAFSLHQLVAGGELDGREVLQRLVEACHVNGLAADAKSGGMSQVMRTIRSGAMAGLRHPRSSKGRT